MTQTLQNQLDTITANTRGLVQPERLAVGERAVEELFASGIEDRVLAVGASAPGFALQDALTSKLVRSEDLLALGPLIVKFFRGRWDPYCMTELESWQRLYPEIREQGAMLVAISPQLQRQNDFAVQQHHLTYPLLTDAGADVAETFGVAYDIAETMRSYYRSILINIPFIHGNQGEKTWRLPLPATFLIGRDGRIAYAEAHADHRVRPEPSAVMNALARLAPA